MPKFKAIKSILKIIDWLEEIEPIERGGYELTELAKEVHEYIKESVSQGTLDQYKWERDVCLEQLNEIGKTLGSRMDDIVALLPKEAHLMTLDEIHALKPCDCIWVEWLAEDTMHRGIELGVVTPDYDICFDGTSCFTKTYKPCWTDDFKERVWSAKPTEDQRSCTPWEQ